MKKQFGFGAYMCAVAAILAVVGAVIYRSVMYTESYVFYLLLGAAALTVIGLLLAKALPGVANYVPICVSFLLFSAIVWAAKPMVNQLGYVVAGLEPVSTVITFFVFAGFALAAGIIAILASFLKMGKEV